MQNSFLFNNVRVKYVDTRAGNALYVSEDGKVGVRVYPDGRMMRARACTTDTPNSKGSNGRRKQRYLYFRDAWTHHVGIQVAHAVYIAYVGPIKPGMTIDHIDGCTTNNDYRNLRQVSDAINQRDGGFLRKLKHKGIDPTMFARPFLLRYFDRMAKFKKAHTLYRYDHLTREQLLSILTAPEFTLDPGTIDSRMSRDMSRHMEY